MKKQTILKRARKEMKEYVVNLHALLPSKDFKIGECLWNFRCFYNSVHYTKKEKNCTAHLVFCAEKKDDYCFLHVINCKNKKWIDNTLGYTYEAYDYYYIRPVPEDAFNPEQTWRWFNTVRHSMLSPFISKKLRKKFNIKPQDVI